MTDNKATSSQDPEKSNQALEEMLTERSQKLNDVWANIRHGGKPNVPLYPTAQTDKDSEPTPTEGKDEV